MCSRTKLEREDTMETRYTKLDRIIATVVFIGLFKLVSFLLQSIGLPVSFSEVAVVYLMLFVVGTGVKLNERA